MQEHNHKEKEHKHDGCCGHDHGHHHVHGHDAQHAESHEHHHEHGHHHTHAHHEHHAHHGHEHHHSHDCCDHDHGHGHKHLSTHECTTLFNKAQSTHDTAQAIALLIESGCGFAHLGDTAATAAVNGLLNEKIKAPAALTQLQKAQINALKALELALSQTGGKEALVKSVEELENFSGSERAEVEQLLADVRKALAGIRTSGLKSLLSKLKF